MKLLQENTGAAVEDVSVSDDFLDKTHKVHVTKANLVRKKKSKTGESKANNIFFKLIFI